MHDTRQGQFKLIKKQDVAADLVELTKVWLLWLQDEVHLHLWKQMNQP